MDSGHYVDVTEKALSKRARKEVVFPDTVREITPFSYYYECNVRKVSIPASLPKEEVCKLNLPCVSEFAVSSENGNYSVLDGVLFSKDFKELICYPIFKQDRKYLIPDGTERIGAGAFDNIYHEASIGVNLPDKLVVVPKTVNSIAKQAFWDTHVKVDFLENNVVELGKGVFMMDTFEKDKQIFFEKMVEYRGGAFSGELLKQVSFNKDCAIVYSQDIDFREYLLFSMQKMIARLSFLNEVKFEFDTYWWDSKYSKHYFRVLIPKGKDTSLQSLEPSILENVTYGDDVIVYSFPGNQTKSHFGERTYKKYLEGFVNIITCI